MHSLGSENEDSNIATNNNDKKTGIDPSQDLKEGQGKKTIKEKVHDALQQ